MPKGSEALTNARKEEIVNACALLYQTMGFREITIRDIGAKTSFTRTSIYNYFQTKEEIFLALLEREHAAWAADLDAVCAQHDALDADGFADALARTLEKRGCMLKLMSMNLYDMETNCRLENLVAFKKAYAAALRAVTRCLEKFFPRMDAGEVQAFVYAFSPFCSASTPIPRTPTSRRPTWRRRRSSMWRIPSTRSRARLPSGCCARASCRNDRETQKNTKAWM